MKVAAIIQARMGSTRLPGKIMKNIKGKTILEHVIERVNQSKRIDQIIIATTSNSSDDIIENVSHNLNVTVFRGSENDVLSRYYFAAQENNVDIIVRITSDCPLIDPHIIDNIIETFLTYRPVMATNIGLKKSERTFPRGLDVEVFSFKELKYSYNNANKDYEREHVTPFIFENYNDIYIVKNNIDYSDYRLTLDTKEDLELINRIYDKLYKGQHDFYLNEIIWLMIENPYLIKLNKDIKQKSIKG